MCDLCDDPSCEPDDWLERVRTDIARRRFSTVSVGGSTRSAEFKAMPGRHHEDGAARSRRLAVARVESVRLLRLWGDYLLDESAVLPGEILEAGPWLLQAVLVHLVRRSTSRLPYGFTAAICRRSSSPGRTTAGGGRGKAGYAPGEPVSRCSGHLRPGTATSTHLTGSTRRRTR